MNRLSALIALLISLAVNAASPIEGDWQVTHDGARLRFAPAAGREGTFDIIWLDGPDFSIAPGTVVGYAVASPDTGVYDCTVKTDPRGKGDKRRHARFVIKLDVDTGDSFTFVPYEQGLKFSPQALLPYWWRRPIKTVDTRPGGIDGARRIGAPKPFVEL